MDFFCFKKTGGLRLQLVDKSWWFINLRRMKKHAVAPPKAVTKMHGGLGVSLSAAEHVVAAGEKGELQVVSIQFSPERSGLAVSFAKGGNSRSRSLVDGTGKAEGLAREYESSAHIGILLLLLLLLLLLSVRCTMPNSSIVLPFPNLFLPSLYLFSHMHNLLSSSSSSSSSFSLSLFPSFLFHFFSSLSHVSRSLHQSIHAQAWVLQPKTI
jgi:hypothetical protein